MKNRNILGYILACVLILLMIVIGLNLAGIAQTNLFQWTSDGKVGGSSEAANRSPNPEIKRINLADAKVAFDNQTAVFLDVRDDLSFKTAHIPGAVHISLSDLETQYQSFDKRQWIITYCA